MDELLQEFIAETRETLEALSGEIIAWENAPEDRARLDAIFRFVHTVKGSCGFLDLPRLERLSHAAEEVLARVRSGERLPDASLVTAVLAIIDRIGEIVEAIDAGSALDDSGEDLLIAALEGSAAAPSPGLLAASAPVQRTPVRSVRLSVELLDRMMNGMSEMVLARNELARRLREANADPALEAALERLSLTVGEMRDTVTRTRMQRIEALFSPLPRLVRDTAVELGKSVNLTIEGGDVELDREMIELMRDPLVHIIRNAIDHGIEAPHERRAAGKRENGRLCVAARQAGNQIVVEIVDDGRGIDVDRVLEKVVALGLRTPQEVARMSEAERLDLVFEPGLSTKDAATAISGRGVGMDVVRDCILQIGGRVVLENMPGRGLRIAIHVPLTLSIMSAIVVRAGEHRFAIPRPLIEEIVSAASNALRIDRVGDCVVATLRHRRMPLVDLARLMGIDGAAQDGGMLVVLAISGGTYALKVDAVLDSEELVIKPAAPPVMAAGFYAGQSLPDSGTPMLLLDCAGIASIAGLRFDMLPAPRAEEAERKEDPGIEILLFEDLDGVKRGVPLAAIDRIEQVAPGAATHAGGRLRLILGDNIVPVAACLEQVMEVPAVLRLRDGEREIAYAIREPQDIVRIAEPVVPARRPGMVAGVVLHDGAPVEMLDPYWLFSQQDESVAIDRTGSSLCLLAEDESGWMATFLRPLLETAGFRVADRLQPGEEPSVILALDKAEEPADPRVVRLRSRPDAPHADGSIYRYDRDALFRAIDGRLGRGGGR